MYGMTARMVARAGKRVELAAILTRAAEVVGRVPGCHLYVVSEALADENSVHVLELWADKKTHDTSLQDERVRELIQEAMPLLDGPPQGIELNVLGGYGLARFAG